MQKMSNEEYGKYVAQLAPKSKKLRNCVLAFLIGGAICAIGQGIANFYGGVVGLSKTLAGTATSMTLIFLSALLTGLSIYDDLAKFGGAGTLVPITGFANAMVSPAMEFRAEGLVTGMAAKLFTIAGPVLVYGISASVIYGLILVVFR